MESSNDTLKVLMASLQRLLKEKVGPQAGEIDRTDTFPRDIWRAFGEIGVMGVAVPEEYGGLGLGFDKLCLVTREIARVSGSCAAMAFSPLFGIYLLLHGGASEAQRRAWLPKLASGEEMWSFCLTEAHAGSDAMAMKTTTTARSGAFEVNGVKQFISFAGEATKYIVVSRLPQVEAAGKPVGIVLIDANAPGLRIGKRDEKMGNRGIPSAEVIMEGVRIPRERVFGLDGGARELFGIIVRRERIALASWAVGVAMGAFEYALNHTKIRQQFGRPIFEFQAVQMILAEMFIGISSAIGLIDKACACLGRDEEYGEIYGSAAKALACEVVVEVTGKAMELLGGYGYMKEYPLERMVRDARGFPVMAGTGEIQKWNVARNLRHDRYRF
ncbi:MAG: hypothetical protein D9V47_10665 [Clostridia bacterium]|nr:MAG: hypothetical protein D9V47_10665 [Clostridia bacterium]